MNTIVMSPREEIQKKIADQIDHTIFNAPYGIICSKAASQKYRTISFGIINILDAEVRIYGPRFILIKWTTGIRTMPPIGTEKCETVDQVINFLKNNFT